jgi:hypothetical protein
MWNTHINLSYRIVLMGGLGNQFFQLARAVELRDRSIDVQLVYISEKLDWLYRLSGHTKHDSWLDVGVLADSLGLKYRSITLLELLSLGFKFIRRKLGLMNGFDEVLESRLDAKSLFTNSWDVGYFQSIKHVSLVSVNKVAERLASMLEIIKPSDNDLVIFHIRGGDFNISDRVTVDDIHNFVEATVNDSSRIFVATNDAKFSSEIFESMGIGFEISKLSPKDDFVAIASARSLFVSNSSFGFWAALCAKNSHNSVVYSLDSWPYEDFLTTFFINERDL